MKIRKRSKIGIVVVFVGVLLWQFGFFHRFNYLTARIELWNDLPRIVVIGLPYPCGEPCIRLKEKYGFRESNIGCNVTGSQVRGIDAYNAQIEKYLDRRNGKGWRKRYEVELGLLLGGN